MHFGWFTNLLLNRLDRCSICFVTLLLGGFEALGEGAPRSVDCGTVSCSLGRDRGLNTGTVVILVFIGLGLFG